MTEVYCDKCKHKRCINIGGDDCRIVFKKEGTLEGVRMQRIEDCEYRED